ncbi:hypothetical protein IFM89_035781 [Coptis chinensis]|uniref:DEAD-box RNA helicase Q domain-containing protein n=1 Tax=Coptis chinensis TaxID=261450 RepID=A0A835I6T4_9MAGN|nr:hypothetical protein IFM89_035781 [Coptis chinensis]
MELNLSRPLLRACDTLGYQKPTPIQAACIPLALMGRDICESAMKGSGKVRLQCCVCTVLIGSCLKALVFHCDGWICLCPVCIWDSPFVRFENLAWISTVLTLIYIVIAFDIPNFCCFLPFDIIVSRNFCEDVAAIAFEIFDELIESPAPLGDSIRSIVQFSLEVCSSQNLESNTRHQAIQIISWLAKYKSSPLEKHKLVIPILQVMCPSLAEATEGVELDDLAADRAAAEGPLSVKFNQQLKMLAGKINLKKGFLILVKCGRVYVLYSDDHALKLPYFIAMAGFVCALFAFGIPHLSSMRIYLGVSTVLSLIYNIVIACVLSFQDGMCCLSQILNVVALV